MYLFDAEGQLLEAQIDRLGPRAEFDRDAARELLQKRWDSLGKVTQGDIRVAPFRVERFGTEFGLIPRDCEHPDDVPAVILMPGDYMAFFEPWEGYYDT
ncbi:MAG: hypothetical protein R3F17_02210 [Planctomycetota bacterium]